MWNQSSYGRKRHVGNGKTAMTVDNICDTGGEIDLVIPLIHTYVDGTAKNQGFVSLRLRLSDTTLSIDETPSATLVVKQPSSKSYQPYSISVAVISASNLPIADIISSDPYVVVYFGDNWVGRTKTISRNLNPVWGNNGQGHVSYFDSLHINKTITFNIYDANTTSVHVLLGVVRIPMSELPFATHRSKYPIVLAERFRSVLMKDPSELLVSITVQKNNSLVRIVRGTSSTTASVAMECVALIDSELKQLSKPVCDAVTATLNDFVTMETRLFIDRDLLRDVLRDVQSITDETYMQSIPSTSSTSSFSSWKGFQFFRRTNLNIFNGRKIDLDSLEEFYFSPIERHSLQINLSRDCKRYLS